MDKSNPNNNTILFENYSREMELPKGFFFADSRIILDSILIEKETLLQPEQNQKITGKAFDFFCDLDLINRWSVYKEEDINPYSNKVDEFIAQRKKELSLFCLGEVRISENFQSFLVLSIDGVDNEYNLVRNLFLVNVENNMCKSLTRVASYTCFDGECNYIFTERTADNYFTQKEVEISTNVIVKEQSKKETPPLKFNYDKKGMVKIL
ncbi:MAG: hypothetical protein WC189_04275 [Bacilli bacterium]